ncbi:chemotaxis protein CheX [Eionea flava]
MSPNILIALLINLGIILVVSWVFGLIFIFRLAEEKNALAEQLKNSGPAAPTKAIKTFDADAPIDYASLLEQMAFEIKEKEDRIAALMAIKENQLAAKEQLQNSNDDESIGLYLAQLEKDFEETEKIILALQKDLDNSQLAMKNMEEQLADEETYQLRISILEKTERRMRDENKKLRNTGTQLAEKLDTRNKQVNKLKEDNKKLQKSLASLSSASQEQLAVIKKLHAQIDRAEKLEIYQRGLIEKLEGKLTTEKGNDNDQEKVDQMEHELTRLKDTLKQTLIEKEFIEEHMLELDESLEKAKETEEALARAQEEIANLEEKFPEYEPPATPQDVIEESRQEDNDDNNAIIKHPPFTTEIPELMEVMENNRLFGSLMEFWATLDAPPLNFVRSEGIPVPLIPDWVSITIGDNDYLVLLTVDPELVKTLTTSIFSNEQEAKGDSEQRDTRGELCNVIAGTIATEMDNNFPVSTPEHIDQKTAKQQLVESTLVAEMLAIAQDKPIYVALMIPKK